MQTHPHSLHFSRVLSSLKFCFWLHLIAEQALLVVIYPIVIKLILGIWLYDISSYMKLSLKAVFVFCSPMAGEKSAEEGHTTAPVKTLKHWNTELKLAPSQLQFCNRFCTVRWPAVFSKSRFMQAPWKNNLKFSLYNTHTSKFILGHPLCYTQALNT